MENPQTGPDPAVMAAIERGNKVVFFDVALGGGSDGADDAEDKSKPLGRIKLELFNDVSLIAVNLTVTTRSTLYLSYD
jgi:hypothetical protein